MARLPCGIYFETYDKERAYIRTKPQALFLALFFIGLLFAPFLLSVRFVSMINITMITIICIVGLQITTGYAGLLNLGQSAFMGMGAFVASSLTVNFHLPFYLAIPAGGLGGGLMGIIFGLPAYRVKGFYLALTTIAAQIIFPILIMRMPAGILGGSMGFHLDPATFLGISLDNEFKLYYLVMPCTVLFVGFAFNLVRTRTGRAFVAIRDNDIVAEMMGISPLSCKTAAFFIGGSFAGVAGSLWAFYIRYVAVDQFTLWYSVWFIGMIIVGGMGNILGAILGTVFIRSLEEMITTLGPYLSQHYPQIGGGALWLAGMNIILGGTIVLFLIFEPKGLVHRWKILKASYRIWPFPYS
ncbi:MAG: leucine/isoleucine/valine transporter permease subunit [Deltaproteobacteria bacterium]|jgi:branched-chain amino acid transport system permease protein|nr:leucine/isoleucine/valine transporter permease subunit [Deltaproteobacteria bacterium]